MMNVWSILTVVQARVRVVVLLSVLAWCAGITSAFGNLPRHSADASNEASILYSTPERVAREILIHVAPGVMGFPPGKVAAAWHEIKYIERTLREWLDRYGPEVVLIAFPDFDPLTDPAMMSRLGYELTVMDFSRIYKVRFPPGADRSAISADMADLPGVLFAVPNPLGVLDPGSSGGGRADIGSATASDFDGDGVVGFTDFLVFVTAFGKTSDSEGFDTRFDLDGDGAIGFGDFLAFSSNFGKVVGVSGEGICGRTPRVRNGILRVLPDVDDCALVTLEHQATIESLSLFGQGIEALREGDFAGLSNLRGLELSNNRLTTLPERIFAGLDSLRVLELRQNRLATLPIDVFSKLHKLKGLALSYNNLGTLPHGPYRSVLTRGIFTDLRDLDRIELQDSGLTSLPKWAFVGQDDLRSLILGDNKLSALPDGAFRYLSDLQRLDLSGNNLTTLSKAAFSSLRNLSILDLSDNPGVPFTLTLSLERTDFSDTTSQGLAAIVVKVDQGAPFEMPVKLSAHGGTLTTETATVWRGSTTSESLVATQRGEEPVTVSFGPAPEIPVRGERRIYTDAGDIPPNDTGKREMRLAYRGIQIATGSPLVLSAPSASPYHRLFKIPVDSVAVASPV